MHTFPAGRRLAMQFKMVTENAASQRARRLRGERSLLLASAAAPV